MFNLTECHFIYNGINSRTYNLVIAHIDSEEFRPIAGSKEGVYVFNKATKSRHIVSDRYEDSPLSIEIEILRCDNVPLNRTEIREVERWLFTNSRYKKLYIDPVDDPVGETYELRNGRQVLTYLNCRLTNAEKIFGDGGVIGFRCDIETDSYMAWQDPTVLFCTSNSNKITVNGAHILLGDPDMDGVVSVRDSNIATVYHTEVMSGKTMEEAMSVVEQRFNIQMTREQVIACDMDFGSVDSMMSTSDIMDAELRRWMTSKYGSGSGSSGAYSSTDFRNAMLVSRDDLMDAFYDVYGSPPAIPATELQEWVDMRYDHVMHPELVDDGGYNLARPEPVVKASDVQQILIIYTESFAGNDMHNTHINTSDDTIIVDAFNNSIDVYVDSDADGYTYPTITIMTGSVGGDIEIMNLSEKVYPYLMNSYRRFRLNTEPDTEYVIDSSINSYSPLGINVISGEFPRLLNGKNVLFFSGNLKSAKIEWHNRRYL